MTLIGLLRFDEDAILKEPGTEAKEHDHSHPGEDADLVATLHARIRHLEGEVDFLRKQLERQ